MGKDYPEGREPFRKQSVKDLKGDPNKKTAVVFCVDTSGSMRYEDGIGNLNKAINKFYSAVNNDNQLMRMVDLAIVEFNSEVNVVSHFSSVMDKEPVTLQADGYTALGRGVEMAFKLCEDRNNEYRNNKTRHTHPLVIIMSDGTPEGDDDTLRAEMQELSRTHETRDKWTIIPVAVGSVDDDGVRELMKFTTKSELFNIDKADIIQFFETLSESLTSTGGETGGLREEIKTREEKKAGSGAMIHIEIEDDD